MGALGIVVDYKSGAASSAADIREKDLLQLPLYMLVLRDQLGLEPVGGRLHAGRRRSPSARDAPCRSRGDPGLQLAATTSSRTSSPTRSTRRARRQWGWSSGSGRETSVTIRRAASARTGATSGACAARSVREAGAERAAARGDRGTRHRLRRRRRGNGEDRGARRAVRPRGRRRRPRRRLGPRDHVHGAGRRRAARAHPGEPHRARAARPRAGARRRLGLDDPRLLPAAPRRASARGRDRSGLPRARRVAGARPPGRGVHGRARGVLRRRRARPVAAPRHLRRRRPPPHARRGLRDAPLGGSRARPRAGPSRRPRRRAWTAFARRPNASSPTRRRPSCSATPPRRRSISSARRRSPSGSSPSASSRFAGPRAASFAEARDAVVAAALEELAARDRELLQELLTTFAAAYADAKDRESALDFEDLQLRARDLLADQPEIRERERQRFRVDHGRRVPGHEPPADRAPRPARAGRRWRPLRRRRRVPVDLRLPSRRRGGVPRASRGRGDRPAADPEPPLAPRGARGRERALRGGVRRRVPARSSRRAASDQPALRNAVELLVTDKAATPRRGVHWRRSEARHVARRVRELVDAGVATPGEIVLLFAAGTDAEWFEEELRALDLPTYRAAGRSYFGQQQVVDLLAYLRLLHNRYDDEALAHRARVAVRRRLERRARPHPGGGAAPADLPRHRARHPRRSLGRRPPPRPGLPPAVRPPARARGARAARAPLRARARASTTTTSPFSRATTASAATRTSASSPASPAPTRSCAAPTSRASCASSRDRRTSAPRSPTPSPRRRAPTRCDCSRSTPRRASSSRSSSSRTPAASRPPVSDILALSDGRFGFKVAHPATGTRVGTESYRDVKEHREQAERAERLRLYYVAMTRAMERLIVSGSIGPTGDAGRGDADRLGARAARAGGGGAAAEHRRPVRDRARRGDGRPAGRPRPAGACSGRPRPRPSRSSWRPRRASWRCSRGAARRCRRPRRDCASSRSCRTRRSTASRASRSARSPCSSAARTATTPSGSSGMRPTAWAGAAGRRRRRPAPDRDRRRRPSRARARRPGPSGCARTGSTSLSAPGIPQSPSAELAHVASLVDAYCASSLARRIAGLTGVRVERPFAFELDDVLLNGRLDVLWRSDGEALVVDYKTNVLDGRDPDEIVEAEYRAQRIVYALACLRAGAERGRGRLPVPRGARGGGLGRRSRSPTSSARARAPARRSRGSGRATSARRRARSPARAALRSTASVRGRDLGAYPDELALPELTSAGSVRDVRVAALYDVHGNLPALEAVLADVEARGVDEIVVGGDVLWGPVAGRMRRAASGGRRDASS